MIIFEYYDDGAVWLTSTSNLHFLYSLSLHLFKPGDILKKTITNFSTLTGQLMYIFTVQDVLPEFGMTAKPLELALAPFNNC